MLVAVVAVLLPTNAATEDRLLTDVKADNGGIPYAGDDARLTTISPNGDGFRDRARIRFKLAAPAVIRLDVTTVRIHPVSIFTETKHFGAGAHRFTWAPPTSTMPRTYLVLLAVNRQ